jgi:hypothetical protein
MWRAVALVGLGSLLEMRRLGIIRAGTRCHLKMSPVLTDIAQAGIGSRLKVKIRLIGTTVGVGSRLKMKIQLAGTTVGFGSRLQTKPRLTGTTIGIGSQRRKVSKETFLAVAGILEVGYLPSMCWN